MWLLILEALAALTLLGLAVWWTMFSGRRKETDEGADAGPATRPDAHATPPGDKAPPLGSKAPPPGDPD